jgi:hypothetical protein
MNHKASCGQLLFRPKIASGFRCRKRFWPTPLILIRLFTPHSGVSLNILLPDGSERVPTPAQRIPRSNTTDSSHAPTLREASLKSAQTATSRWPQVGSHARFTIASTRSISHLDRAIRSDRLCAVWLKLLALRKRGTLVEAISLFLNRIKQPVSLRDESAPPRLATDDETAWTVSLALA